MMTGVDTTHVPYRGSAPVMTDLLTGRVQVFNHEIQPPLERQRIDDEGNQVPQ